MKEISGWELALEELHRLASSSEGSSRIVALALGRKDEFWCHCQTTRFLVKLSMLREY